MKKKGLRILLWVLLAAVVIGCGVFAGVKLLGGKWIPGTDYHYESSLRWYETVGSVVVDGKLDDAVWKDITPYEKTTNRANRAEKYEALESRIRECNATVYTAFSPEGLFLYAETDDPVVNTSVVSPLAKTAFEFYLCSQEALTKWGNIFEFTVSADNCLKLRVREHHPDTGLEGWVNVPSVGIKSYTRLKDSGYSVECFIPWSTLNMDQKPEKLQLATAMIRVLDPEDATNFVWECFDYYSAPIALNNSATFPLFDETGYLAPRDGDAFQAVSSNILDLSTDTGDNPYVTALNRSTVTTYLKQAATENVYWQATVKVQDFNPNDDPRVGIVLEGEEKEDGSYSRVYLMLELEKSYTGQGYQLKHALMLPSSQNGNDWQTAQRYALTSHIANESFRLAVMKLDGVFYFFLDDVLVGIRNAVADFDADTKVRCGITSWYTGAEFTDYQAVTENLEAILDEKQSTLFLDENKWKLYFDLFHQDEGFVTTEESDAWRYHSIANFRGVETDRFYAETDIRIDGSLVNGNGYAGFVLTEGENRLYILLTGTEKGIQYVEYHSMTKDVFEHSGTDRKVLEGWDTVKLGATNKLAIYRNGKTLTVLVGGKVLEQIDLSRLTYPITGKTQVGLTGWKVKATFSDYSVQTDDFKTPSYDRDSSSLTHGDYTMTLGSGTDLFAETFLKTSDVMKGVYPRVGLRLTNRAGSNLDFVVYYNKDKAAQAWLMVRPTNSDGADVGTARYFAIDSAVAALDKTGIRLSVAKQDGILYFYANDVLLGTAELAGFGANSAVTAKLYSKFTKTDFSQYRTESDVAAQMQKKQNGFTADESRSSCCFDVLNYAAEEAPRITICETCSYKESSVVHFNGVNAEKLYAKANITLNNASNAYAGLVLTDGENNRFYVMIYGTASGITYLEYFTVLGDDFDGRTSLYDAVTFEGGNRCSLSLYKDGANLLVYADDALVKTITLPEGLSGKTRVGLAAWKGAEAEYAGYEALTDDACPAPPEPEFVPDASNVHNGSHIYYLNETPYENLKAYTTVTVSKVLSGVSPRVGLRLESSSGKTLDVIFSYKDNQQLWTDWLLLLPVEDESKKEWVELAAGTLPAVENTALRVEKALDTLSVYIGDTLVYSGKVAGFGEGDTVKAALYSRYTEATFTDYGVEELVLPAEDSELTESCHQVALNPQAATELFAEAKLTVADVASGVSPRVGLRLTNAAGEHVDFFVYYNTSKVCQNWLIATAVTKENTDSGAKQYYGIDSAVSSISGKGIKLAVAKKGAELYFYANDVLLGKKTYPGFGEEDPVVASLYSKNTQTDFSDYSVKLDVTTAMAGKKAAFLADGNRSSDCFDALNYASGSDPRITVNETCSNAQGSILNWNGINAQRLYAETTIALNNATNTNAYAGLVLSDGENNRFYVMTYGNAAGITYMEYFTVMGDDYNGRTSVYDKITVAGGNQCTLAIYKEAGELKVYVDDKPVKELTLPEELAGKTQVGLAAWKNAKARFTDYAVLPTYATDITKSTELKTLASDQTGSFYTETVLRINAATTGVYSRVGLRLSSGEKHIDCVVYFTNKAALEPYILLVDQNESNKKYSQDYSSLIPGKQLPLTVRLGVKREGENISLYLNGVLLKDYYAPESTQFACFGADDAITVSLYSKLTDAVFAGYTLEPLP